jgi:uncharacterized membrane protein
VSEVSGRTPGEQRFDLLLAHVLRTGVLVAAALVIAGAIVYFAHGQYALPRFSQFVPEPGDLRSVGGILADARQLNGPGLMQLGVLALIATPIVRVAFSVVVFLRERDWLYSGVTLIVLALLLYGIVNG